MRLILFCRSQTEVISFSEVDVERNSTFDCFLFMFFDSSYLPTFLSKMGSYLDARICHIRC